MKRLIIEISIGLVLLSSLFGMWKMFQSERREKKRFEINQNALLNDVTRYKTSDSLNVLEIETLTLTKKEFKQHNEELLYTVDKLNLKVNRLISASKINTKTETDVKGNVTDSIFIYRDKHNKQDTIKLRCIEFDDGWVTANGCSDGVNFIGTIISRDSLTIIADKIPKFNFWFIHLGAKGVRNTIISSNPHTIITHAKVIDFKRGRK